jgi:nicotinamide-nucleotide amidase
MVTGISAKKKSIKPAERLARALKKAGGREPITLSVAESCTGGLVADMITDVTGCSSYFLGSVVAYHDKTKKRLLGVKLSTIKEHGAVSEETAAEMALGVNAKIKSRIGLSITGIAGPGGGSDDKPVGTVYIGIAIDSKAFVKKFRFKGTRRSIKRQSATAAITALCTFLRGI